MMPRAANNSSTMRRPSGKRKYSQTPVEYRFFGDDVSLFFDQEWPCLADADRPTHFRSARVEHGKRVDACLDRLHESAGRVDFGEFAEGIQVFQIDRLFKKVGRGCAAPSSSPNWR